MIYNIKKGDTLSEIAQDSGTTISALLDANSNIKDADKIYAGDNLVVPGFKPAQNKPTTQPVSSFVSSPDTGIKPEYIERLAEVESGNLGYDAVNPSSGAYGKYQFIPSTAKAYAEKLGIQGDDWKTPENQDRMFSAFTSDNVRGLRSKNLPTDLFHIYGAHQQGLTGFSNILAGKLTPRLEANMRSNVPNQYKNLSGTDLRDAWINYWKNRMQG